MNNNSVGPDTHLLRGDLLQVNVWHQTGNR